MASKRVVKTTTDWIELAKRVPAHQKSNLVAFKSKSDGFMRKVNVFPEEPPKIDWAFYKANAANKAVVEKLEKQYNALKISYPSDNGAIAKIEAEQKEFAEQLKQFASASNERIKQYEKELVAIRNAEPYDDMTFDEFAYVHPELSIDSLNRPTHYPHTPEFQLDEEDLKFFRKNGVFPPGPDKYFK